MTNRQFWDAAFLAALPASLRDFTESGITRGIHGAATAADKALAARVNSNRILAEMERRESAHVPATFTTPPHNFQDGGSISEK